MIFIELNLFGGRPTVGGGTGFLATSSVHFR